MEKFRVNIRFFAFLAFSFLFSSQLAQAAEKVADVALVGLRQGSPDSFLNKLKTRPGSSYSQQNVSDDIKTLYATGAFSDVSASRERGQGGVRVVFTVSEKALVGGIVFQGNKKIKDKDLKAALLIRSGGDLNEGRLAESVRAIQKLYEDKDYALADVTYKLVPLDTENNETQVIFVIVENRGAKVARISFIGNKAFSDRKLTSQMRTKVKGLMSFLSKAGKLDEEKLKTDVDILTYYYLNNGYLKVQIGKPQVSLTRDMQSIYITIPISEGEQYKIGEVSVAGDILTTSQELNSKLKVKKGQVYSRMTQDQDIQLLTSLYGDQAYAFAAIYPDIIPNDDTKTADVAYNIQKGPKIFIERIEIKGNTITHDKVVRREMQIVENAPYNQSSIDLSRRRLMQLGYFSEVNFSTPRGTRDDRINLVVDVKEKPTGSFSVGAGFSSLESFIFNASVSKDNFFGRGIKGSVGASVSKLRQEFNFSATDRYFLDTRWIVSTNVHRYTSALNTDFDERSFGGSISFGRELFPFFDISLGYSIADVAVSNFSSQVPDFFRRNASGITSSLLSTVAYDTRDNRILTRKGMYHSVSTEYAGNGVGGDNNFLKVYAESRGYIKGPWKSVLKARALGGYVNSMDQNPVPLFERMFLGGVNTLRGFDQNTIGPKLRIPSSAAGGDTSFTFGGNRMLMFNLEYEVPIYEPAGIRTVVFFDAGQAFSETEPIDISRLRMNYGAGLRWQSPFGPLRFEWGFPIDKRRGESFTVFNFTIGQSF